MQITLLSKTGAILSGELKQKQAKTLVIMCYGYKSTPEHPAIKIIGNDLNKRGCATFVFRFTSEALAMDIKGQTQDIESIVEHFSEEFDKIVLLASSLGALSASIAAARSNKIDFLITVNGFFGLSALSRHLRREFVLFRLLASFSARYRRIWRFYKYQFLPRHIKAHTLVIHCPTDTEVLIEQSHYFYAELTTKKEFQELILTDHDLSQTKDAHTIAMAVIDWLNKSSYTIPRK